MTSPTATAEIERKAREATAANPCFPDEPDNSTRCERCGGNGWRAVRNLSLGPGLYEVRCDDCNGFGWVEGPEDSRP